MSRCLFFNYFDHLHNHYDFCWRIEAIIMASSKSFSLITFFLFVGSLSTNHHSLLLPSPSPPQVILNATKKLFNLGYNRYRHLLLYLNLFHRVCQYLCLHNLLSQQTLHSPPLDNHFFCQCHATFLIFNQKKKKKKSQNNRVICNAWTQ